MNFLTNVLTGAQQGSAGMIIIFYIVILVAFFYFMIIRPQKKNTAKQNELMNAIQPGDSVMTTSGFYGTVIDLPDEDTVIVEFGNNKNCRIPMHKRAIAEVEKPESAVAKKEESSIGTVKDDDEKKNDKKSK